MIFNDSPWHKDAVGGASTPSGLDERGDDGPVFSTCIVACEEGVLAVQGDGTDGAFDGVVVALDAAIGQEAAKAVALFSNIGQRLSEGRFCRGVGSVMDQPVVDTGEDRGGAFQPDGQSWGGGVAGNLDLIATNDIVGHVAASAIRITVIVLVHLHIGRT